MANFGLTEGVLDRKPLSLAIECHLGLCVEKYPQEANAVMLCWSMASFMGQIKPKPRPDWSLLGVNSNSPTGIPDTFIWEGRAFWKQFLS